MRFPVERLGPPFDDRLAIAAGEEPGLQALDIVRHNPLPERRVRLRAQRSDQLGVGEGRRRALEDDRAHLRARAGGDPVGHRRAARARSAARPRRIAVPGTRAVRLSQRHGEADLGIEEALLVPAGPAGGRRRAAGGPRAAAGRCAAAAPRASRVFLSPRSPSTSTEVTWTSVHSATTATTRHAADAAGAAASPAPGAESGGAGRA